MQNLQWNRSKNMREGCHLSLYMPFSVWDFKFSTPPKKKKIMERERVQEEKIKSLIKTKKLIGVELANPIQENYDLMWMEILECLDIKKIHSFQTCDKCYECSLGTLLNSIFKVIPL